MTSRLIQPTSNKNKLYILLAVILISAISIILISIGIVTSNSIDQGSG
ncbi:MAG: hypothetical protein ACTSV5_15445 [Promethearchaeota archaeon]